MQHRASAPQLPLSTLSSACTDVRASHNTCGTHVTPHRTIVFSVGPQTGGLGHKPALALGARLGMWCRRNTTHATWAQAGQWMDAKRQRSKMGKERSAIAALPSHARNGACMHGGWAARSVPCIPTTGSVCTASMLGAHERVRGDGSKPVSLCRHRHLGRHGGVDLGRVLLSRGHLQGSRSGDSTSDQSQERAGWTYNGHVGPSLNAHASAEPGIPPLALTRWQAD